MSSVPSYGSWLPPAAEPPEEQPRPEDGAARWAPWTAAAAFAVGVALTLLGVIAVGIVGAIFGASFDHPPPAVNIVATVVQDAAFVGAAVLMASRVGRVLPAQFGIVRTRIGPALGWMTAAFVTYAVFTQAWATLVDTHKTDKLPDSLGADQSTVALVAVCVMVTVIAPLAEELFFRGYVFGALRNWRGPWPAALITGLVFGAVHAGSADVVFLPPLAVLGFMLCVVRWQTGSLLPCIALHAFNNGIAFAVTEGWSVGAGLALVAGAVLATMLVCAALLPPPAAPAGRALI